MFKSKIFQYCAIASTVVAASGAIWASNTNLQSQSAQSQIQAQSQTIPENKPESEPEILAQVSNRPDRAEIGDIPSGRMLKQLNLSTEQLQKLKSIRDRDLTRIRELAQQSRQANTELRDLLDGSESSDVIRAKHNQALNLQQELRKQHFERMLAMREVLTPQQRSQLKEIMQKNRPNHPRENMKDRIENRLKKRLDNL
ncbi:periplasmic heavy metal sensor [Pseudanabaena sp. UWO311]|uniref:Spy/CpxP family protein refolding chaperone n=1 Tax=Pseudanabaena sp. UWO311 TaxID=2487337 RepID=UPI001156FF02|nr:Spy/CpxP family protein refolding chaperone [Pseudanabaena sp. UWO311]TYQ25861.1 periplasmic heavy metal sensor [Pseudanabaena sp. UWO311]